MPRGIHSVGIRCQQTLGPCDPPALTAMESRTLDHLPGHGSLSVMHTHPFPAVLPADPCSCAFPTDDLSSSDTCNVESLNLEELELPRPSEAWTTQEETQEQPRPSPGLC